LGFYYIYILFVVRYVRKTRYLYNIQWNYKYSIYIKQLLNYNSFSENKMECYWIWQLIQSCSYCMGKCGFLFSHLIIFFNDVPKNIQDKYIEKWMGPGHTHIRTRLLFVLRCRPD
jgi:hypothetical protein